MCAIEGCESSAVAKGLCTKHYARLRRTDNPNVTRRAGPKTTAVSRMLAQWSPSTRARYRQALRMLCGESQDVVIEMIQRASRSNGSVNVSKLLDMAACAYVARHDGGCPA
jgi:hypothetical protein